MTINVRNVLVTAVVLAAAASAQQVYPVTEGYLGFIVNNNSYGTDRHNSPGVQMSFSYNPHRNLRIVGDVAVQFHDSDLRWSARKVGLQEYQVMVGPEVAIRNRTRVTPFARALAGYASRNYAVPNGKWYCNSTSFFGNCYESDVAVAKDRGFGMAFGAGVDWDFGALALRLVQFDVLRTHLSRDNPSFVPESGTMPTVRGWQNNYRFSTGIVLRLGSRQKKS